MKMNRFSSFAIVVLLTTTTTSANGQKTFDDFDIDVDSAVQWSTDVLRSNGNLFPAGPTLSARQTSLNALAYFDALAPFTGNATGILTRIERRPEDEHIQRNKNLAVLYAITQITRFLTPDELEPNGTFRKWIVKIGIEPEAFQEDEVTPQGIGIKVGHAIVVAHADDGVNLIGDKSGKKYKKVPYSDYTGYKPVNTAFELNHPSRWQPLMTPAPKAPGKFCVQHFVTPHFGRVTPFSGHDVLYFTVNNHGRNRDVISYKQHVDDILRTSAGLTDDQKMIAEYFDDKFNSLPASVRHAATSANLSTEDFVTLDLMINFAVHDTLVVIWNEKWRHDAVRPVSAVAHVYADGLVRAWAGPGNGVVNDLPANQWKSYIPTADHPEYPSASAAICSSHAEAARKFFRSDNLNMTVKFPKGSSKIEPGVTPSKDLEYTFHTWSQFERDCGLSRVYGGVHFRDSIEVVVDLAHIIAGYNVDLVLNQFKDLSANPIPDDNLVH